MRFNTHIVIKKDFFKIPMLADRTDLRYHLRKVQEAKRHMGDASSEDLALAARPPSFVGYVLDYFLPRFIRKGRTDEFYERLVAKRMLGRST